MNINAIKPTVCLANTSWQALSRPSACVTQWWRRPEGHGGCEDYCPALIWVTPQAQPHQRQRGPHYFLSTCHLRPAFYWTFLWFLFHRRFFFPPFHAPAPDRANFKRLFCLALGEKEKNLGTLSLWCLFTRLFPNIPCSFSILICKGGEKAEFASPGRWQLLLCHSLMRS